MRYKSSIYRSHLFGKEVIVVGSDQALKGDLGDETCVQAMVPVATFKELVDLYNMADISRHKLFVGAYQLQPQAQQKIRETALAYLPSLKLM
jgi:hypothetical protein